MATAVLVPKTTRTFVDLHEDLGGIPLHRILIRPDLGGATEADVIELHDREGRLCELIDGVLVEKTLGIRESLLAIALAAVLRNFVAPRRLGIVTGADGAIRLNPGQVRIPDVSFFSGGRLPGGVVPKEPIPDLAPDLAIEVLSDSNTKAEMLRKRRDYFDAGVLLVWEVDPATRTVQIFEAPEQSTTLAIDDTLDGGAVLPGFVLPLRQLFEDLDYRDPARPAS